MDKRIVRFLKKHHIMALATATSANDLWCSNAFYAFLEQERELIFTSDPTTQHARQFIENPRVAANVVLNTKIVGRVQGIQLTGQVREVSGSSVHKEVFLKRFPYAVATLKELWALKIDTAKLTDNTLGFGVKLYYPEQKR